MVYPTHSWEIMGGWLDRYFILTLPHLSLHASDCSTSFQQPYHRPKSKSGPNRTTGPVFTGISMEKPLPPPYPPALLRSKAWRAREQERQARAERPGAESTAGSEEESDEGMCAICLCEHVQVAFVPCHHVIACRSCAESVSKYAISSAPTMFSLLQTCPVFAVSAATATCCLHCVMKLKALYNVYHLTPTTPPQPASF